MILVNELVLTQPIAVRISTAAKLLDCSYATVAQYVRDGKLKTVGLGADRRVLVRELEEFMRSGRGATKERPTLFQKKRGRPTILQRKKER